MEETEEWHLAPCFARCFASGLYLKEEKRSEFFQVPEPKRKRRIFLHISQYFFIYFFIFPTYSCHRIIQIFSTVNNIICHTSSYSQLLIFVYLFSSFSDPKIIRTILHTTRLHATWFQPFFGPFGRHLGFRTWRHKKFDSMSAKFGFSGFFYP